MVICKHLLEKRRVTKLPKMGELVDPLDRPNGPRSLPSLGPHLSLPARPLGPSYAARKGPFSCMN